MARKIKGMPPLVVEQIVDVEVVSQGSVVMVHPRTQEASDWVEANVPLEGWQWFGDGFACEPRMVQGLIDGMEGDGLVVRV